MPPDNERRRPYDKAAPLTTERRNRSTTFAWRVCPEHRWLGVSVIDSDWCVGDGEGIPGHWVDASLSAVAA